MDDLETTGLDADIVELLDAERVIEAAPTAVKERVWDRVHESITAAPASPPLASTAASSMKGTLSALGIATLAGVLVVTSLPSEEPVAESPPALPQAPVEQLMDAPVAPASALLPVKVPVVAAPKKLGETAKQQEPTEPSRDSQPVEAERKRKTSDNTTGAAAEQALLDQGRRALREGRAAFALKIANQHQSRYRRGRLAEERDALRIRALSRLGRSDASREAARSFMKRYPTSIHRLAVERVLGAE